MPDLSVRQDPGAGLAAQGLTAVYAVFALAAAGRSGVQLATHASRAPLAYTLSAFAAAVYVAGVVALRAADRNGTARRWALRLCVVELAGVIGVGASGLIAPQHFPEASVWSGFGSGYGYLPLALPLCALWWLRRSSPGCSGYTHPRRVPRRRREGGGGRGRLGQASPSPSHAAEISPCRAGRSSWRSQPSGTR